MFKVSVIIPAYNAEKTLLDLLRSLAGQTYSGPYEIIVVDNDSSDLTMDILKNESINYPVPFKILKQPRGVPIARVRNYGAKHASGDIFAFIDSDCEAPLTWIQAAIDIFKVNGDSLLLAGSCHPPDKGTWVEKAWHSTRAGHKEGTFFVHGANFFISKKIFEDVCGFREDIETSEDYDLGRRVSIKYKILTDQYLQVTHYGEANTLIKKIKKERWYSRNMIDTFRHDFKYKPFWITLTFLIVSLLSILSLVASSRELFFIFLLIDILLSFALACFFCFRANNYSYFFQLIPISFSYLVGRSIGLVDNFIDLCYFSIINEKK